MVVLARKSLLCETAANIINAIDLIALQSIFYSKKTYNDITFSDYKKAHYLEASGNKNILVIDDSKPILEFLKRKIESSEKLNFFGAESFAKAKELIAGKSFFAAIVDMELPDAKSGDALELTLENSIPSIVLTGSLDANLRAKMIAKPIVDYARKDGIENIEYVVNLLLSLEYLSNQTALIVDDSRASCRLISESFKTLLLKTVECTDPLQAIDILKENKNIKVVTLDYEMPHLNGVELAKKIRSAFSDRDIAIFGVSASNSEEIKYQFLKNGASSYFIKPIIMEEFTSKIINHMKIIEQKEKLNAYIDTMDKYIITSITDTDGKIRYVSRAFCDISGYTKEELIGQKHSMLKHPDMNQSIYKELWEAISSGKKWSGEIKNRKKDGGHYWVKANIEPIRESNGQITGYQAVRIDITDKKIIEQMSITDELTGLYNRRFFNAEIFERLEEAKTDKKCFAFFIMDVDHFKKYNDTYGHKMGDDVLRSIGKTMKEMLSLEGDVAFRLGGEEFGGLIGAKNIDEAVGSVGALREALEGLGIEHSKNTASQFVTASFGVVFIDFSGSDFDIDSERVYIMADEALYEAKESGRNRVSIAQL